LTTTHAGSVQPELDDLLGAIAGASVREALAIWRTKDTDLWSRIAILFQKLAERLLSLGEALIAYDVVSEGLKIFPRDIRLVQLLALALARSGATSKANSLLSGLVKEGQKDEETLGILARTYKDLGLAAPDPLVRMQMLRDARDCYLEAFRNTAGHWTGINAGTLSLLIGERELAARIARQVREQCLLKWKSGNLQESDRFWLETTLGEASLILGEASQAQEWYERARQTGPRRYADLHSASRNAQLILRYRNESQDLLSNALRLPAVAAFVGHMVDVPKRTSPRFPSQLQDRVKQLIRERIEQCDIGFGYSSAACGSDILFLETLLELGKETSIVLPYCREQFRLDSVDVAGENWGARFEEVLRAAARVIIASDQRLDESSISLAYGNTYLQGLASLHAMRFDSKLIGIAVWDGKETCAQGGTSDVIEQWRRSGLRVEFIDVGSLEAEPGMGGIREVEPAPVPCPDVIQSGFTPGIRALLFADAVGFSKLRERQIPKFVLQFLGGIAQLIELTKYPPEYKNTWGDGLYLVFDNVKKAGMFALELRDLVQSRHFGTSGLPESISLRIALHAGPVYSCFDPVMERTTYVGTHVSRAARMEPITPPGEVYASEAFAALAAADGSCEFVCDYVGETPQAKGYGTFPTYLLRRQGGGAINPVVVRVDGSRRP